MRFAFFTRHSSMTAERGTARLRDGPVIAMFEWPPARAQCRERIGDQQVEEP